MFLLFFVDVVICSWYGSWIYVVLVIVLNVIVVSIINVDVISHIVFVVGFNHINDLKSQKVWKNFLEKLFIFHNAYNKGNIFDIWLNDVLMSTFTEQEHHCYGKFNITFLFLSKMLQNSCRIL